MKKSVPWIISLVLLLWAVSKMMPPKETPGLDVHGFGKLPVLVGGRVMPMDTLAQGLPVGMESSRDLHDGGRESGTAEPGIVGHPHDAGTFGYGKTV